MAKYKQITEPDIQGFQVRIVRNKKEYSRYFSHNTWGSKLKSLKAAISWRDQMLVLFKEGKKYRYAKPLPPHKKSTGVLGVSKTIQFDKRRGVHYMAYSCHWRLNDIGHTKTFHVGRADSVTPDEEFHAFRTAVLFRKEYEMYKEIGKVDKFPVAKYSSWRKERIYDKQTPLN